MRAVLDTNVLVSAVLSQTGAPAQLIASWLDGDYELIVSPSLLGELSRALAYPKVRKRLQASDAKDFLRLLQERAVLQPDPEDSPQRARDRRDDYLLALAESQRAMLVSGDQHLLDLAEALPVLTARQFLRTLESEG